MSLTAAAIRIMAAKGMSAQDIADIAEANETAAPVSKGAERTRRWRENKAKSVTGDVTVTRHGDVSHVGEPAQVVISSLPSLRSEEVNTPTEPNGSVAPKGAETGRGTRIPENWSPVPDYEPEAFGLNRSQHDAELTKFLDYWRSVPGAKGRKSDWSATWRNWMRRASENSTRKASHERPHHDAKFDARQANNARAFAGADRAPRWEP